MSSLSPDAAGSAVSTPSSMAAEIERKVRENAGLVATAMLEGVEATEPAVADESDDTAVQG